MRTKIVRIPALTSFTLLVASNLAAAQWERTIETVRTTHVEVLTSGPVHEAFAETVVFDPEPDVVVVQPPPEPIDEDPPDHVPDGPNMTWIPGYWAWDDDRDDYLWISGVWRSVPPGRRYVPGFWARVGHGYQWTSGFWVDDEASEIEYLPEPPEPVEAGPPPPAPSPNLIWTPGVWIWDQDRYVWRPGHWVEASLDWVWIPAHYVWGPRGYIFVDGYWDYPIHHRGVLFAPVYVTPHVRATRFVYRPEMVIDLDIFTDHLFVRPRYRHYYFGDYYAAGYVDKGIYPWFAVHHHRVAYDPIYVHRRWRHRHEPDWERDVEARFRLRRDDERYRPARTFELQVRMEKDRSEPSHKGVAMAKTLQQMVQAGGDNRIRFRSIDRSEKDVIVQKARANTKSREERKAVETRETGANAEPIKRTTPVREKLPSSPISAKKDSTTSKAPAPKKPDAPQADRSVAPKAKPKVERITKEVKPQPSPRPAPEAKPDNKKPEKDRSPDTSRSPRPDDDKAKRPDESKTKRPDEDKAKRPDDDEEKSKSKKKDKDKDEKDKDKDD